MMMQRCKNELLILYILINRNDYIDTIVWFEFPKDDLSRTVTLRGWYWQISSSQKPIFHYYSNHGFCSERGSGLIWRYYE